VIYSVVANEDVSALQCWYNAGVDFNLADYNGHRALHIAVAHCRTDHVAYLLAHGADPRAVDIDGITPLDEAKKQCLSDIVLQLKDACNSAATESDRSCRK